MSEENRNRCPKCDKGKLRSLEFRATESDGRKRYSVNAKTCQICKSIFYYDPKMKIYFLDANNGIQSA
ncbi:hypothetical protein K0U27_00615 [archaeon]|nr:hypothetical protein [archaeon]